ncbi:hypothetical protein CEXT_665501 [Caerostris extrusa]|uniref:Maturase K n=1 Tax=Caerostris extrusa TaxID=172846 RepID=A0AAV4U3S8_CAEEX|nr:hypothetical protein CEXT_665501 [Caerostris extrusa]
MLRNRLPDVHRLLLEEFEYLAVALNVFFEEVGQEFPIHASKSKRDVISKMTVFKTFRRSHPSPYFR